MFVQEVYAVTIHNPLSGTSLGSLTAAFTAFATGLVEISGIIFVLALILAGFYWMTAAGNSERIATAKQIYFWAILGMVIIFSAYTILQFVLNVLGKATIQ